MASTKRLPVIVLLVWMSFTAYAQENRYMVFFTDKDGVSFTVSNPGEFLSPKAIDRRMMQGISIVAQDLPVNPLYVSGIRDAGASTFFTTRWMNGVLVECEPEVLTAIEALPYVDRVEYVAPHAQLQAGGRRASSLRRKANHAGGETGSQLQMLGLQDMHASGVTGEGVTIAILDSGFPGVDMLPAFSHIVSNDRLVTEVSYDFAHNSHDVFGYDGHGTEVLSVMGALIPDAFTGGAYDATFQLFITEDVPTEYRVEEYNWLFAAERADSAGADIIHSSLGYYDFDDASMNYSREDMDGKTTVVSRAAQWAADRGILVITSAGNEGNIASWRIITAPADAQGVLAIGGVNSNGQKTGSSSIGPSADGRIKPDLVALGASVKVVKQNGQISTATGTSLAAPLATSLAAGVMQRYNQLTNTQVMDLLRQTASQANQPDQLLGFGIPNFQAVVNFLEQTPQEHPFEVFPNPLLQDTLIIRPFDPNVVQSCEIQLVNGQGAILRRHTVHFDWLNRTYRANFAGVPAGVYYVRILHEKSKHTFRVVKL